MAADGKADSSKEPKVNSKSATPSGGNTANGSTVMPKDGQVMMAILKDMGVTDFEPKVINQLLEFSYRYATNILEDAKIVSGHAKKKTIDLDDVTLAVQMYTEHNVTTPPGRDFLLEMSRAKNSAPLPIPKPTCGLRLPPDRFCLTACNYRLKMKSKSKKSTAKSSRFFQDNNKAKIQMNQQTMPQFQITPQAPPPPPSQQQQQPVFKISVNPQTMQTVTQPVKRKADEMEGN